jgi:hypothetical protein
VFKRVLINHFWNTTFPPFEHNRIPIENIQHWVFEIGGGGAVLLLWAHFSPFLAWIAKNGIIRALEVRSSPLVINELRFYQRRSPVLLLWAHFSPKDKVLLLLNSPPKDGEMLGVTAKHEWRSGSLCLCRRLQFPFNELISPKDIYLWLGLR